MTRTLTAEIEAENTEGANIFSSEDELSVRVYAGGKQAFEITLRNNHQTGQTWYAIVGPNHKRVIGTKMLMDIAKGVLP